MEDTDDVVLVLESSIDYRERQRTHIQAVGCILIAAGLAGAAVWWFAFHTVEPFLSKIGVRIGVGFSGALGGVLMLLTGRRRASGGPVSRFMDDVANQTGPMAGDVFDLANSDPVPLTPEHQLFAQYSIYSDHIVAFAQLGKGRSVVEVVDPRTDERPVKLFRFRRDVGRTKFRLERFISRKRKASPAPPKEKSPFAGLDY